MYRLLATRVQKLTGVDQNNPPVDATVLELATVKLYGSDVYALMHSGTIPNFISPKLWERMGSKPEES